MNKLKIAAAITLLASGGMMFAACGKKEKKDPYKGQIVVVKADDTKNAYNTWAEAVQNAQAGETIELHSDVELDETANFATKSLTIDGQNKYEIKAGDSFTGNSLLNFGFKSNSASELVFAIKNCKIDAEGKSRAIYVDNSKLTLEGCTVTGGHLTDGQGAGVVITGKSVFVVQSGDIDGNTVVKGETELGYDEKASEDVWLGSEVNATVNGGHIGKIFKNANKSGKEENQGSLVLNSGKIDEVYVEYDNGDTGYAATFTHNGGTVDKVIIRKADGQETTITSPAAGKKYTGNKTEGEAIEE